MKEGRGPLIREFSTLGAYQSAHTLICTLEPGEEGCWLNVCRRRPDGTEHKERAWVSAPEEACWNLLRFLYENSVQPELWQDAVSCWYPQEGGTQDEQ